MPDVVTPLMQNIHWTWIHTNEPSGKVLGKRNVINNYCVAVDSNEPRCTSCHIGIGWRDDTFDFTDPANMDCLVCHDTTGTYKKTPTGAGVPDPTVDLLDVAQNVGSTSRQTCGACHFFGGGGDAVKHGDLDSTMTNPPRTLDVHMGVDGQDMTCADCHLHGMADPHTQFAGSTYTQDHGDQKLCEDCHTSTPHPAGTLGDRLNTHTARLACQTCHIPQFARGGKATKMTWDWSTAGDRMPDGSDRVINDADGNPIYHSKKGTFTWEANVVPEYLWFNGEIHFTALEDTINPAEVVRINDLQGDIVDAGSRITPVKRFTGRQPYDAGNNTLAVPHLFPSSPTDTDAYWKGYDWTNAVAAGMAAAGAPFSGTLGWVETEMFWVQNHMVAPVEESLGCSDCHTKEGRLDFAALGYPPEDIVFLESPHTRYVDEYVGAETCLSCHGPDNTQGMPDMATPMMQNIHWTWVHTNAPSGKVLGKRNVINNYCVAVDSNEPRCTSCHIGVGWRDDTFDFTNPANMDCLVCHDTTGTYQKTPTGAGVPDPSVDLLTVAQNVGPTSRQTCGACHFFGGGGDGVKHGDLDSTMTNPTRALDVHMGVDGHNMDCADCHLHGMADSHTKFAGSTYTQDHGAQQLCEDCHSATPHPAGTLGDHLNTHTARLACQACHVPLFARGGQATKMTWDWSTAGDRMPDGSDRVIKDAAGNPIYHSKKGSFTWESNAVPEYVWFNGEIHFNALEDTINPAEVVRINSLQGSIGDANSRIMPVKRFTGRQPYDAGNNTLAVPHLFPSSPTDTDAYWKGYNWTNAVAAGMAAAGAPFSGTLGWVETEMFWLQNHMVAPAQEALACDQCHTPNGRLDFLALGYSETDAFELSTKMGYLVEGATRASGGGVAMSCPGSVGLLYNLEYSTNLVANPPEWQPVPDSVKSVVTSGETMIWTNGPTSGSIFYRIMRSESD